MKTVSDSRVTLVKSASYYLLEPETGIRAWLTWKYWSLRAWISGIKGVPGELPGVRFVKSDSEDFVKGEFKHQTGEGPIVSASIGVNVAQLSTGRNNS